MSATTTNTADELVACPRCRGVTNFREIWVLTGHVVWIRHACGFCVDSGRVLRAAARAFWLQRGPSA